MLIHSMLPRSAVNGKNSFVDDGIGKHAATMPGSRVILLCLLRSSFAWCHFMIQGTAGE